MATTGNIAPSTPLTSPATVPVDLARLAAITQIMTAVAVRWTTYFALFIVPLLITSPDAMFGYADVPKITAVRVLAGVIAAAWLAHTAAGVVLSNRSNVGRRLANVDRGTLLIGISALAFFMVAIISSITAVSHKSAFIGAYPGFDATDLYSLASYLVIGAAVARFLWTRRDIERAVWSIALAGTLASIYGIAQYAGIDPLHFDRFEVNDGRTPLTFGNPSFAGSFLTISLFASVGLFFLQTRPLSRSGLLAFAAISVQVFALGTTASRGAWVGVASGSVLLGVLLFMHYRKSTGAPPWRHVVMLTIPVFAVSIAGLLLISSGGSAGVAATRLQSFNSNLAGSGLNGRQATWTATLELIGERPWVIGESSNPAVRHLFGYGPDTYRYVYQLVAPDEHADRFVPHAHNSFLHIATELGLIGLLVWSTLTAVVIFTGVTLARSRRIHSGIRLLSITTTVAFTAHAVDQLANVPRAADTLAMWVLAGIIVALALHAHRNIASGTRISESISGHGKPVRQNMSATVLASPPIALIGIAVIATVTILGNAGHVMADRAAGSLQSELLRGATVAHLSDAADNASGKASDVAYYHTLEAVALETAATVVTYNPVLKAQLTDRALDARQAAAGAIPFSPAENFSYARALLATGHTTAAVERNEFAVELSPNYWAAWLELASAYALAGMIDEGTVALGRAEELIAQQAMATREDRLNVRNFIAVRQALGTSES